MHNMCDHGTSEYAAQPVPCAHHTTLWLRAHLESFQLLPCTDQGIHAPTLRPCGSRIHTFRIWSWLLAYYTQSHTHMGHTHKQAPQLCSVHVQFLHPCSNLVALRVADSYIQDLDWAKGLAKLCMVLYYTQSHTHGARTQTSASAVQRACSNVEPVMCISIHVHANGLIDSYIQDPGFDMAVRCNVCCCNSYLQNAAESAGPLPAPARGPIQDLDFKMQPCSTTTTVHAAQMLTDLLPARGLAGAQTQPALPSSHHHLSDSLRISEGSAATGSVSAST